MSRIAVVGDALIDELRTPEGVEEHVGGAGLNVAVGLASLGDDVTLIAMVGEDAAGAAIRAMLAEHGVRLLASPAPHGSSRAVSTRDAAGEPRYEFNAAARARRIAIGPAERAALDEADLVAVSCVPFDDPEQQRELVAAVREPERRLVVDPNPRAGMLADRVRFRDTLEELAPRTALLKLGGDDAELLYGEPLEAVTRRVLALAKPPAHAPLVLATDGPRGARIARRDGLAVSRPIFAHEGLGPVIDTMGAGDATLASIVHDLAAEGLPAADDGAAWGRMLERAMRIASATVRARGALLRTLDA